MLFRSLEVESDADLMAVGEVASATEVPVIVIGKGSNVLVSDEGFPGIVVRLGRSYRWAARERGDLVAGGAMPLPALAGVALTHRLTGLEFGVAIPASLGGAVKMNAGAHGRSLSEVVTAVEVHELRGGERRWIPAEQVGFRYRRSELPEDGVVIGARVALAPGSVEAIREEMAAARRWRRETQPLAQPNCGSVFTNPPGDHAARLIEAVDGKGFRIGGAEVSRKHANFIVADPGARASDVAAIIGALQRRVRERFEVELEPEVRFVGEFDEARRA